MQFATTSNMTTKTRVHGYPLPPEGRQFRPQYVRGQYNLPDPVRGGTKTDRFTRVTTGAHALDETSGLEKWKLRNVVLGLHAKPELIESLDLLGEPRDVTRMLNDTVQQASDAAGASDAAEKGTAIHAWIEACERDGASVSDVPRQFQPFVTSYFETLERAGVEVLPDLVERIVWHAGTGWVGTFDNVYKLADGTQVIGDKKTSKSLQYGYLGFSMQLAVYADADKMLLPDGTGWVAPPAVGNAYGLIAHIPSNQPGKCELVTIDLETGRRAIDLAEQVRFARANAAKAVPNRWELPQIPLRDRVARANSSDELAALWNENSAVWTPELTQLGMARIAELTP